MDFTYSQNFALLQTQWFIGVCVSVCVRLCVSGCVYIILFSALWPICRLYTQKFSEFLCFCWFPIHFLWSVIFDRRAQVWLFFLRPLSLLESFLCVHAPNAIKVTKFRTIPMKLWFLKIQNRKFSGQMWPKSSRGRKIGFGLASCVCVCMFVTHHPACWGA